MARMSKNLLKRYFVRSKEFDKVSAHLTVEWERDSTSSPSLTIYVTESGYDDDCRQLWVSLSATEIGELLKDALAGSTAQQQDEIFKAAFSGLDCEKTLDAFRRLARVSEAANA